MLLDLHHRRDAIACFRQPIILVQVKAERAIANVARKLGFTHEGTLRRRVPRREGPRGDAMVFTLLREELPGSPCMAYAYTAYDVLGTPIVPSA